MTVLPRRPRSGASLRDERGIALVLAIFALTVIGALVGTTFLVGRVEQQSGRNTLFAAQAREAAEAGLSEAVANVDRSGLEGLAVGGRLDLGRIQVGAGASAYRQALRLTSSVVLIESRAARRSPEGATLAACAVGALVVLTPELRVVERGWAQLY